MTDPRRPGSSRPAVPEEGARVEPIRRVPPPDPRYAGRQPRVSLRTQSGWEIRGAFESLGENDRATRAPATHAITIVRPGREIRVGDVVTVDEQTWKVTAMADPVRLREEPPGKGKAAAVNPDLGKFVILYLGDPNA